MASGFNIVDYMDLTSTERQIVRLVLRQQTMTYPQLREAFGKRHMDQAKLDNALNHLTHMRWLIPQMNGRQVVYRVNSLGRINNTNPGFLDSLDLEDIQMPESLRLQPDPKNPALPVRRGGKRVLPNHIWESLNDANGNEESTPPFRAQRTNSRLADFFADDNL